ncbi:sulfite exporter TauE/SafE family protein [Actinomadura sp. BRA 177]|uniref:sulfite exporter TauE/SafE family protein n=1 Tax=Actinomadura sp. BRA 177 TaxID=2745202 RepID=UPI001595D849|nr:sulfite exporter TauE/SafE family protein [Actinomadura sp. BRA 177]NVI92541.1 sulfite exporter TauE/SafE family protein [Actinomadura sp. BRA 177]
MAGLEPWVLAGLVLLALAAGVGITAVGPGGVLITVGLFAFTDLSPAQVAGTAIVTNVATGLLGTAVYTRSGQLREPATRRTAALLAAAALVGTPLGVLANGLVTGRVFGVLLGVFIALVAVLVLWRRPRDGRTTGEIGWPVAAAVGAGVAVVGAMFGVGGPLLSVPLLVALGMPVLPALAAAQAQSVVIAAAGTIGYVAAGAVDWHLAALMGVPELAGVLAGWMIARAVPATALKAALVVSLLALAPYVALHG